MQKLRHTLRRDLPLFLILRRTCRASRSVHSNPLLPKPQNEALTKLLDKQIDQQDRKDKRLQRLSERLEKTQDNLTTFRNDIRDLIREKAALQADIAQANNEYDIRSALEIVAEAFETHDKNRQYPARLPLNPGVQRILSTVAGGYFDDHGGTPVVFDDAVNDIVEVFYINGIASTLSVNKATRGLYNHLIAAALSVILFARRKGICPLDVIFYKGDGVRTKLSQM
ncbi:hypothetical protein FB45DRAFT_915776 [Roridomyces roridus]|uniref:Uncharacterized protein n=1 Tax=Roridomyces roridus TaxID=1738132 RepID=A0AAD7FPB3_9AGAR|nr:hypothetical protein FB45DRAFT_915776 [Roridomyces roridus]